MVIFLMLVVFLLVIFLLIVLLLVLILLVLRRIRCLLLLTAVVFLIPSGFWLGNVVVFAAGARRHWDVLLGFIHCYISTNVAKCSHTFVRCELRS